VNFHVSEIFPGHVSNLCTHLLWLRVKVYLRLNDENSFPFAHIFNVTTTDIRQTDITAESRQQAGARQQAHSSLYSHT
jgi:hypothetical protein